MKNNFRLSILIGFLITSFLLNTSIYGDSLWKRGELNLIKVKKATNEGDIVKVLVYEIPTASTKSNGFNPFKTVSDFLDYILNAFTGVKASKYVPTASISDTYKRENQVSAKVVLEISSVVIGKDDYGNLIIKGKKKIKIGGAMKEIIIKGKIRPEDITADNTVDSRDMAEAEIWVDDEVVFKKSPDEPDSWLAYFLSLISNIFM